MPFGHSNSFDERPKPGKAAQRLEVGIVLEPLLVSEAVLDRLFEDRDRLLDLSLLGVRARDIVEDARVLGIYGERAFGPLETSLPLAEPDQRDRAHAQGAGVVRIELQVLLDHLQSVPQ